jgi:hypothetical protein
LKRSAAKQPETRFQITPNTIAATTDLFLCGGCLIAFPRQKEFCLPQALHDSLIA